MHGHTTSHEHVSKYVPSIFQAMPASSRACGPRSAQSLPARGAPSRPGGVRERALVGAAPVELERQRAVADAQQLALVLGARPVMAGDHAGHGLLVGDRPAHAHLDVLPGVEPAAAPRDARPRSGRHARRAAGWA